METINMTKLTVVAKVVAKKESVETVKSALLKIIEPTRQEDGCIEYFLHQDNDNPTVFIFYENWKSDGDLEKHMKTAHFNSLMATIGGIAEEIVINKLTQLA
jgi:quinol monooxygenase YgiN